MSLTSNTNSQKRREELTADFGSEAVEEISNELRRVLADVFALCLKTKNFHWHMTGPRFRDYHLLLDEQADQIFGMTDVIAERARKIGGRTLRSIGGNLPRTTTQRQRSRFFVSRQDAL